MNEVEKKMLENGFTAKDMRIFRHYMEKDSLVTHLVVLHELKCRFIVMGCITLLIMGIWIAQYFYSGFESFAPLCVAMVMYIIIAWFMTPARLAFKAFYFIRNNRL